MANSPTLTEKTGKRNGAKPTKKVAGFTQKFDVALWLRIEVLKSQSVIYLHRGDQTRGYMSA